MSDPVVFLCAGTRPHTCIRLEETRLLSTIDALEDR